MNSLTLITRNFSNKENIIYYEKNSTKYSTQTVRKNSGLTTNQDLKNINRIIKNHSSFLEIGVGDGRVIDYTLNCHSKAKIFAIERCQKIYSLCQKKYSSVLNVNLFQQDILLETKLPFVDVSLLMFSVFSEFNPIEQKRLLNNLAKSTSKHIVIDLPLYTSDVNGIWKNKHTAILTSPTVNIETFTPDKEMIKNYIEGTSFKIEDIISYETDTNRKRVTYILNKT